MAEAESKRIAGLVGPSLIAVILSENPFVNPHLYDEQIPPVVYLSGVLLLVGGLSIVRIHNRWTRGWPILVTLTGWLAIALGLLRMFAPISYSQGAQVAGNALLAAEAAILAVGITLTFKAYSGVGGR